jgi:hypothetical protein
MYKSIPDRHITDKEFEMVDKIRNLYDGLSFSINERVEQHYGYYYILKYKGAYCTRVCFDFNGEMTSAISRGKLEEIINSWKKDFGG